MLQKLERTRSIDLIRMPFVAFVVKSHNLGLAIYKTTDKHNDTVYVVATAHRTLNSGEDQDVIYLEEDDSQGAAGIVLYAEDTGRYGLQQRSETVNDAGLWAAWGGGRESGETLEQCARRELAEEGGYTGPIELQRLGENSRYVTFLGRVPQEFEPRANSEWQDYCWVKAGDWPGPMHPGTAAALANISTNENFADGKVKGKSRPGRVKRAGASCNGSVTDLRARAKKASGEKARMYHWCANMKSGRKK
jgi:8-oxo-dGTP pyrophosphatase MutT (NUDIX family)